MLNSVQPKNFLTCFGRFARVMALAVVASAPIAALPQVPLSNPSFEQPALADGQYPAPGQIHTSGAQAQFSTHFPYGYGWQPTGEVGLIRGVVASAQARFAPPMGRQWVSLRPGTAITQTVNLQPGSYSVSLSAMQWMDYLADVSLRVSIGAQAVILTPQNLTRAASGTAVPKMVFSGFSIASAGNYVLRIDVPLLNSPAGCEACLGWTTSVSYPARKPVITFPGRS